MIEVVITAGGSGLADEILEALASVEADFRVRLVDGLASAGEARRFQGRTLMVELSDEADLASADLVLDLARTYEGTADRFRPDSPAASLWGRAVPAALEGKIRTLWGSVREPAVAVTGGVDALAGQVTQLFNGRDPEEEPFGGQLAFNSRWLDPAPMLNALKNQASLQGASVALERWQSDQFYTLSMSCWVQTDAPADVLALGQAPMPFGAGLAPNAGRMDINEPVQIWTESVDSNWVHLRMAADLERTLWSQDAKDAVLRRVAC